MADIPGLIEGAHEGHGLGIQFLKHLSRTKILLHLVDTHPYEPTRIIKEIQIIENELKKYSSDLANKPRWIVFNKMDLNSHIELSTDQPIDLEKDVLNKIKWNGPVYKISAISNTGTDKLIQDITQELKL